ncbi:AraC family transcriptional regulator [Pectinatus sottacetonis]|uniref:AraC family transcriptional regulator n=1 Tax=Pectinatus sottacetonis TaxID=1002795 RepID=UPI001E3C7209|nr:AraC family transcriptional regulator [Pectinatus sottacetonis]
MLTENYEKKGYLIQQFKVFRLKDHLGKIPFHYHEFHKIILFISGKVDYIIEGKSYPLVPRDIIFVSAGEIHRPIADERVAYERIVIYISLDFLDCYNRTGEKLSDCFLLARNRSSVMHLNPGKTHDILYHMEKLENNAYQQGFANELYTEILFIEFMILLNRALLSHEIDDMHIAVYDKKILPILQYINKNLFEELTIDALAEKFYMSRFYMMRRFKKATGYSIHQYIVNKRLLCSQNMLASDIPLTKICFDCGFHDYSTFSRAFKELFKQTPKQYRKKHYLNSREENR